MKFPLIGNERIKRNISLMVQNNKIPHAIILEGENGLGKKTLAKFLAKAFLCKNENAPCDNCKSCHLACVGSHPDLMHLTPEGVNYAIDQIRNLKTEAFLSPMMCDGRVFIIDFADSMTPYCQNALLQVLEEPPQRVCFILLCQNASSLLQTIRSRCVPFTLSPVPIESEGIEKLKTLISDSEKDAAALLAATDGNIGKAVIFSENDDLPEQVAHKVMLYASEGNKLKILESMQPFVKKRDALLSLITELKNILSKEMQKKAVKEYSSFTYKKLLNAYERLKEIEVELPLNPSVLLVFCIIADILT